MPDSGILGILLLISGSVILILTWFVLRVIARAPQTSPDSKLINHFPLDLNKNQDAIFEVESGGRLLFLNQKAREWFDLQYREPSLELLARQVQPSQVFLSLCTSEGQARLSLNGRVIDASSFQVPSPNTGRTILVVLHQPDVNALTGEGGARADRALAIYTELSQKMASSLDLETTLLAVLESVERLVAFDFSEITLWDPASQELVPFRFVGLVGVDRRLERTNDRYKPGEGYSGYLVGFRKSLLVGDIDNVRDVRPALDRQKYPFRSYLGIPLLAGNELVGTLEMASFERDHFSETDQAILTLLGGQAAVALHNAVLFQQEQQQSRELAGLAQLVQVTSAISSPESLVARLVGSLHSLFDVERLGFLLYDETRRMLICQEPFIGIPAEVVELYQLSVPDASPADHILKSQDMVIAPFAPINPALTTLGINQIAEAAGMRDTILVPLASTGRFLGYLQVANKSNGQPFGDEDIRLLAIVAGQVGPLLANAALLQETRQRAQRSEALRRISNLAGSAATLDEILNFSLLEIQRMLDADVAVIYLLDERLGMLQLHEPSALGVPQNIITDCSRYQVDSVEFKQTVTNTQHSYLCSDASQADAALPYLAHMIESLDLRSLIVVPLVIRDRGVGELILASSSPGSYSQSDQVIAATSASQLAGAIERAALYSQTDEKLRQRVDELTAVNLISREISATHDLPHLLTRVLDESLHGVRASGGRIILLDLAHRASGRISVIVGQPDQAVIFPLEQTVLENGQPLVVADLADYRFAHQELNAQSAVLVPIMYEGYPLGVINLWANKPGFFDSVSQEIVQTFSFQASTGVANVLRYQDQERQNVLLKQRVETLARLMDSSRMQQISQPLEASLTAIAEAIRDATPFNVILISVYDPAKQVLQRVAGVGFTAENLQEMSRFTQPWRSVQEYLQEEYRFGQIYFIPTERKPVDPPDIHTVYVLPKVEKEPDFDTWHTDDLLLAPLLDGDGSPLGLISVDDPRNNLRPDRPTLDTLELFASQAALTIESHLAVGLFNDKLVDAEQRLVRAEKAAAVTQENLPLLLHKDLEQTVTLNELSQRVRRAQAGLEIAEQLNRQSDREAVLDVLGSQLLIQYGMDVVLIAETAAGGPRLVRAFGTGVERVDLNALLGQRNPLRQSLQIGKMVFSQNLAADTAWQGVALLQAVSAGSFVCFPVGGENNPEIAVLLVNQSPLSFFDREDERLFQMLSRQAGIALRNLRLVTETDQRLQEVNLLLAFSRQLGSLDLSAILDTLLDTALKVAQNAQGGVVLLWDTIRDFLVCHAAKGYAKSEDLLGISYSLAETLPGRVVRERQSMRVDEVNFAHDFFLSQADLLSYRDATQGKLPVSSLLVPIQSGELPLGLLILEDFQMVGGFTPEDQALIDSLAQQAALAMENARLYEGSELRARQLQALTDAAGAMSASLQTEELIQGLLQRLRSLVEFDTGAVWLREGERLTVQAAEGFADEENRIGLEVDIQDSQLFKSMIRSSKPIVVPDVRVDDRFLAIDESPFLSWLGLPLIAKGDVIGVIALQKKESDYYSPESIQVLTAFASQAAVSIQNAMLFDDSLSRAIELDEQTQRLSSLNRYTTVLSSSLDQGHILRTVIGEIQRQISSTTISIALFDKSGKVQVYAEAPQSAHTLPYDLPDAPVFTWIREHHSLLNCADISLESDLTPLMPFLQEVNTISLLLIPLTAGSELQGVIFVHEGRRRRQFSAEEIDVLQTIAGQATISLQNARLYDETQLRLSELTAINQISQSITTTIDLGELINRLPEQLAAFVDTKNMYLALFDPAGDQVEFPLAYENGEPVELPAGKPAGLTGFILSTKQPLLLVGEDVPARLETLGAQLYGVFDAASYLGVPLLVGERVVGVLAVQSPDLPYAYTVEDVRLLTTVAAQVATAIENSRLYTETRQRSADLARLLAYSSRIANELDEAKLLEATFSEVQQAFGAELVAVISRMPEGEWCAEFQENGVQQKVNSYFMQTGNLHLQVVESSHPLSATAGEGGFVSNRDFGFEAHVQGEGWVGVPLTARGETFGVLSLAGSRVHRFGEDQLVLLSQVGNQLGTALDSARLFTQVQNYAAELEERVQERTRQLAYEHSRTETLLRIITELSASLDMDIVLNRTLNLINEIVGAEQSTILLVEAGEQVLLRRASVGYTRPTPEGGEALAMRPDEGLSGWVIKRHEAALVADVLVDDRWVQVGKTHTEHRSVMAVPLLVGEEVLGVLMLFHRLPDQFSTDHLDLVQATAKQIAVAINNSKLYRLIRDQAERLGDMLRTQHVEMTRSQAILEAVADGVLVTDSLGQITLFNASAEQILQLKRNQVQGRPLESFIGLFGKAARSWMDTIHTWSRQSSSYQAGEVYSERIEMEDGRVVSVHLSPVHLRSEFLGTVSIFRDVTHEVELSRLKSEFVANVSHELRTPMTSIKGYVDILLMGATGDLTEQQRTFLNVVKSNTERLVVLVNDLLEVSRLEAGKVKLVLEPIDLRHMVEEVALEMRQRSVRENRPMNIHVKAAPALERALADPDRIRQVIENLVDNAYHYTPANGDITIRLGDEDNRIRVDIQDTGIGIPLSEQEQVFERFYRGEDPLVLETPGTGLGLSVVKTLVEMHQGRIWLYSSGVPGEGSTFSFVIPVYTEEKKAVGIFSSTPPATR